MGTTTTPAATPAAKTAKTYAVTLSGSNREQMRVIAIDRKTGPIAYAQLIVRGENGKVISGESKRGADARFENLAEATAYVDRVVQELLKKGWVKRTGGGGSRSKPPAFDLKTLPSPKGVPAKK